MIPLYQENQDTLQMREIRSNHFPPHLHKSIEIVYVTKGTLELGVDAELYHMEQGDLGFIFPNQIHHFQVFDSGECRAVHLLCAPSYFGSAQEILGEKAARTPVIPAKELSPDILLSIRRIGELYQSRVARRKRMQHAAGTRNSTGNRENIIVARAANLQNTSKKDVLLTGEDRSRAEDHILSHAWVQILLVLALKHLELIDRPDIHDYDIVYQALSYVAAHFKEDLSLGEMAEALGVSPFALSRIFSKTFHMNFNQYVNDFRLEYATACLREGSDSITDIMYNAGFQSQATFNRAFRGKYHMTPREYRTLAQGGQ